MSGQHPAEIYVTAFDVPSDEAVGAMLRKPVDDKALVAEVSAHLTA